MAGNYVYHRRSSDEIRSIAHRLLERFPTFRYGTHAVDIEKIQEALGFEIIYRQHLGLDKLKGYVARDVRYIVVSQLTSVNDQRFTIAHELSHKILEFHLWTNGTLPKGSHSHELTEQQNKDIEENAWELAAEMLEPYPIFNDTFNAYVAAAQTEAMPRPAAIFAAAKKTAEDFQVILRASARRALMLGLITPEEHTQAFPLVL